MKKKLYISPEMSERRIIAMQMICDSLPQGEGDDPGVAEGKERDDFNQDKGNWGNLW